MTTVNTNYPATSTTSNSTTSTSTSSSNSILGKDDFLKLLITQMQNQDPLNPQDDTQSIAQMAQFSSLEQMQNMNTSVRVSQATNMISDVIQWNDDSGYQHYGTVTAVNMKDGQPQLVTDESLSTVSVDGIAGKTIKWVDASNQAGSGVIKGVKYVNGQPQIVVDVAVTQNGTTTTQEGILDLTKVSNVRVVTQVALDKVTDITKGG